jgi:hypothetical protein
VSSFPSIESLKFEVHISRKEEALKPLRNQPLGGGWGMLGRLEGRLMCLRRALRRPAPGLEVEVQGLHRTGGNLVPHSGHQGCQTQGNVGWACLGRKCKGRSHLSPGLKGGGGGSGSRLLFAGPSAKFFSTTDLQEEVHRAGGPQRPRQRHAPWSKVLSRDTMAQDL